MSRFGDNAKAAIIARGLAEITRLGVARSQPLTFARASFWSYLIVTGDIVHPQLEAGDALIVENPLINEAIWACGHEGIQQREQLLIRLRNWVSTITGWLTESPLRSIKEAITDIMSKMDRAETRMVVDPIEREHHETKS